MAKKSTEPTELTAENSARLVTSDADKVKAEKWFTRARELGSKRQFDYAIEYYVNGLEFWPDAVEEACKALHGCAVARKQTGGKKPGLKDTMKRSINDKDAKKAFLNALWLFGKDPDNVGYVEAVTKNAGKLRAEDAGLWAAGMFHKAVDSNPKATAKHLQSLITLLEALGDRAAARGETKFGVESYRVAVEVVALWRRRFPKDQNPEVLLKHISTKLTILKGAYEKGDSYRDSISDSEGQRDLHDKNRSVQSDDRMEQLIAKAEAEYEEDSDSPTAIKAYVGLLTRREHEEDETKAIGILTGVFDRLGDYRWKQSADDLRMKQLVRKVRAAAKAGDAEAVKQARIALLRVELDVFEERIEKYPTDLRLKFELGVRQFNAGRFDDAIPTLQAARADSKSRAACGMYLGRCFFRKNYQEQAISALQDAISTHGKNDDELGKNMHYWLARAQEAGGDVAGAKKTYGDILQADYNFRDVRARLDGLQEQG
jgi:tetratricopeptide (TPR) repeat protein